MNSPDVLTFKAHWSLVLTLVLLAGCVGDDGRPPLVPVDGSVRVDGQPAAGVQLRFYPAGNPGDPDSLKPTAVTGPDGSFALGTYAPHDGAPAGSYKVTLYLPTEPPTGSNAPPDRLGGRYLDPPTSPVTATVGKNPTHLEPFAVEAPKTTPRPRPKATKPDADGVN